jgi:hypothetical protein
VRISPSYVAALSNRAHVLMQKVEFDKAIADASAALRVDPKFSPAYLNPAVQRMPG